MATSPRRPPTLMPMTDEVAGRRTPAYDPDPLFLNRWSARSMTGEPLEHEILMSLFEAARWAPSSRNNQPWRFCYAPRDGPHWDDFLSLLSDGNRRWATEAAVLVLVASKTTFDDGSPSRTHSFDAGAAWENLALEATRRGLVVHPMAGFDYDRARELLSVPGDHAVEAMVALGHRAPAEALPEDLRDREQPNGRAPLDELVLEGGFGDGPA